MSFIPWYVTLIRLIVPVSILRFPLWGIVASMFADGSDWNLIGIKSKAMDEAYQRWDKSMDLYAYLFTLWIVIQWKDKWAKRIAIGLFGYRMVGQILFFITKWRAILFFFPNLFENFVIVCLIIFWRTRKQKLNLDFGQKGLIMAVLIVPKMFQEYFQHILVKQPWEIYSLGTITGLLKSPNADIDTWLWITLLYIIPISGLLLFLSKQQFKYLR